MDAEPALPDAFFNAGFYYLKKYNYTRAKDCFETFIALTHTPGIGAPRDAVGNLLGEDEMDDQTMDRLAVTMNYKLKRAAELLNHIEEQHLATDEFRLAYECINRSEEEQGIAHIRTFLERNPTVWNAWFLLGWGLRRKERWTEAKEAFVLALKHGEAGGTVLVDTYNEMAICCLELKEYAEAEKLLYRAINIESENTKIMSNMGFVCLKQDKPDEALSWFTTVLEFDPEDELAQKMVEELT
jgi:tetratricopeptide (TPR) repeat protein